MKQTAGIILLKTTSPEPEVLLVRSGRHWSIPKGKVRRGEALYDAARRELLEETKIVCPEIDVYVGFVDSLSRKERLHAFVAHLTANQKPTAAREIKEARFFKISKAIEIINHFQSPLLESLYLAVRLETA